MHGKIFLIAIFVCVFSAEAAVVHSAGKYYTSYNPNTRLMYNNKQHSRVEKGLFDYMNDLYKAMKIVMTPEKIIRNKNKNLQDLKVQHMYITSLIAKRMTLPV